MFLQDMHLTVHTRRPFMLLLWRCDNTLVSNQILCCPLPVTMQRIGERFLVDELAEPNRKTCTNWHTNLCWPPPFHPHLDQHKKARSSPSCPGQRWQPIECRKPRYLWFPYTISLISELASERFVDCHISRNRTKKVGNSRSREIANFPKISRFREFPN